MVSFQDGQFNMDYNTLMFIAGQAKARMPQAPKRPPNAPLGPCYNCGGDHLIKDCPYPRQPRQNQALPAVPALARYCLECGIKHLVSDCPLNPDQKGKATLNILETIPSSSGTESEGLKPMNVMTRAQKQNQQEPSEENQTERSSKNSWKARRQRRNAAKKQREEKAKSNMEDVAKQNKEKRKEGSVFAGQVLEPLHAMLDAFEARLKPNQTLEERMRAYPDPQLKTKRLEIFQKMIEGTQALLQKQMDIQRSIGD